MHGPINLTVTRRLGPAARAALKDWANEVLAQVMMVREGGGGVGGGGEPRLISEFGELSDTAVRKSLLAFDDAAGRYLLKHSPVARRIHRDLT